jgi:hypothetical protein
MESFLPSKGRGFVMFLPLQGGGQEGDGGTPSKKYLTYNI